MKEILIKIYDKAMEWSMYFLIFCLPFTKAGIEIFASIAIIAWLFKKFTVYKFKINKYMAFSVLNNAILTFLIVNIISVIISVNFDLSIKALFGKTFEYTLLYLVIIEVINNNKRLRNMFIAITASAVIMLIDSGVQYFRGFDFLRYYPKEGYYLKASFFSHNGFGGWLVILVPIFLCLPFWAGLKTRYQRIGVGILGILLLICLYATYSRGAWLGLMVGFGFIVLYIEFKTKKFKYKILISIFLLACLIGIFLIAPSTIKERLASIPNIQEGSGLSRINAWQEALSIIKDYPLFGSGLNTYSFIGSRYKMFEGGGIYPHNSFLQMAAETGVVGLICFILIIVELFNAGMKILRNHNDNLLLGLLAGILSFLAHSFFDNHLYSLQLVIIFWFIMGLAVSEIKISDLLPS